MTYIETENENEEWSRPQQRSKEEVHLMCAFIEYSIPDEQIHRKRFKTYRIQTRRCLSFPNQFRLRKWTPTHLKLSMFSCYAEKK